MSLYLFGPLIKQRREELGYTQEDLADGICSVPTLSRIENGERLPNKRQKHRGRFSVLTTQRRCNMIQ